MAERQRDHHLYINTTGMRNWDRDNIHRYNRTESTPYRALDKLFKKYNIEPWDKFVDFGCGKGRTLFYIYDRFDIEVTGIELNDITFGELERNKNSYLKHNNYPWAPINLQYGYAQDYEIDERDNIFYFFNPFNLEIFKKVVQNINKSLELKPREVEIILYYPLPSFVNFLEKQTHFYKSQIIRLSWKEDRLKKFIIFKNKL